MKKAKEEILGNFFGGNEANSFNSQSFGKNLFGQSVLSSVYDYFDQLCNIPYSDFVHYALSLPEVALTAADIPQFSCLNDAIHKVPRLLDLSGDDGMILSILGEHLLGPGKKLLLIGNMAKTMLRLLLFWGLLLLMVDKLIVLLLGISLILCQKINKKLWSAGRLCAMHLLEVFFARPVLMMFISLMKNFCIFLNLLLGEDMLMFWQFLG